MVDTNLRFSAFCEKKVEGGMGRKRKKLELTREDRAAMEDFPDMSGHQVYACGAPIVVDSARADFVAQCKLPEEEFFADSFVTEKERAGA